MQRSRLFWRVAPFLFVLAGCLSVHEKVHTIDFANQEILIEYHDIRSRDENKQNDNFDSDWASLQEELKKNDFDSEKVRMQSKEIFKDGNVLSGRALYRVECMECFDSKVELLKEVCDLDSGDGFWDLRDNEIVLVTPLNSPLKAINARQVPSGYANIYLWPVETTKIEFVLQKDNSLDRSLLPKYLEQVEKDGAAAGESQDKAK